MNGANDGTILGGRYVLDSHLGSAPGGAERWSAHDTTLDRRVTVWVAPDDHPHADAALDGARRAASVSDPRLARVLDVGRSDGVLWVADEALPESRSLAEILAYGALPAEEIRRLVGEAANALEAARHRGLHHLHLSPTMLRRDRTGDVRLTGTAVVAGLAGDDDITPAEASRADTEGLAALLFAGLTGLWPLEGEAGIPAAPRLASGHVPSPSELVSDVPADLDALVRLILRGEDAPRSPGELARELAPWDRDVVTGPGGVPHGMHPDRGAATAVDPSAGTALGRGASPAAGAAGVAVGTPAGDVSPGEVADWPEEIQTPRATAASSWMGASDDTQLIPVVSYGGNPGSYADDVFDDGLDDDRSFPVHMGGNGDPSPTQTRMALALVGGFLALALSLAAFGVNRIMRSMGDDAPPTASATQNAPAGEGTQGKASGDASADGATSEGSDDSASSGPYPISAIKDYDPEGDQQEKPELVAGINNGGTWRTHYYLSENWGGMGMSGMGVRVDLGQSREIHEVTVTVPGGTYDYEIYVGDTESHTSATKVASYTGRGSTTTTVDSASGRYVFVWFTKGWKGPNGYMAQINEIEVS